MANKKVIAIITTFSLFVALSFFSNKATIFFGSENKTTEEKINSELLNISDIQKTLKDGKHKRQERHDKDGISYETIEYVTSSGEIGYQVIITGDTFIKSVGYGPESESRTFNIETK